MTEQPAFLYEVMDVLGSAELCDEVWWHGNGGTRAPQLLVNCNDFFYWACADCEPITPANLHHLRAAIAECEAIPDYEGVDWITGLFCAKARDLRPQGCCYPKDPRIAALFDACGPKRDVDFGNPYQHPEDGGKYAYKKSCELPAATNAVDPSATDPGKPSTRV